MLLFLSLTQFMGAVTILLVKIPFKTYQSSLSLILTMANSKRTVYMCHRCPKAMNTINSSQLHNRKVDSKASGWGTDLFISLEKNLAQNCWGSRNKQILLVHILLPQISNARLTRRV